MDMDRSAGSDGFDADIPIAVQVRIGSNVRVMTMVAVMIGSQMEREALCATANWLAFCIDSGNHEHRQQTYNKQDTNYL